MKRARREAISKKFEEFKTVNKVSEKDLQNSTTLTSDCFLYLYNFFRGGSTDANYMKEIKNEINEFLSDIKLL